MHKLGLIFLLILFTSCGPYPTMESSSDDETTSDTGSTTLSNVCAASSGCSHWFDASDASTMFTNTACSTAVSSSGDEIRCWTNKGSDTADKITRSAGFVPSYEPNSINSLSVADFTGVRYTSFTSKVPEATDIQFFIIKSITVPSATPGNWLMGNGDSGGSQNSGIRITSAGFVKAIEGDTEVVYNSSNTIGSTILVTKVVESGTVKLYVNSNLVGSGSVGTTSNSPAFYLGGHYNNASVSGGMDFFLAEMVFYDVSITEDQRTQIENKLKTKWGI